MRHRAKVSYFGRSNDNRKALVRNLVRSLVLHGRIETTLAKAKELRRHVERAVTMAKKGSLHARRILLSRYPSEEAVNVLLSDLAKRFENRPGGYTRVIRTADRKGDKAEMAYIEFVDHVPATAAEGDEKSKSKSKKLKAILDSQARKNKRIIQNKSRRERFESLR